MGMAGDPAADGLSGPARAFRAWMTQAADEAPETGVLLATAARLAAALSVDDLLALGMVRHADDVPAVWRQGESAGAVALPAGSLKRISSPGGRHVAMSWLPDAQPDEGARWWIDGHELPVTEAGPETPGLGVSGSWVDDGLFTVTIIVRDHALLDHRLARDGTGGQFGLLLWNADAQRGRMEWPAPDEAWRSPWAVRLPPEDRAAPSPVCDIAIHATRGASVAVRQVPAP